MSKNSNLNKSKPKKILENKKAKKDLISTAKKTTAATAKIKKNIKSKTDNSKKKVQSARLIDKKKVIRKSKTSAKKITVKKNKKNTFNQKLWKTAYSQIWNFFEHSQIPTLSRTSNGKVLNFNKAALKFTGYTKDEVPDVETWITKLYPNPRYRKSIKELINNSFTKSDVQQHVEVTITIKSGDNKDVLALYNNVFFEGHSTGVQIVQFLDISDRKKAEEENKQQKYLIDQLLQNVPDKIYFKDLQSRFIAISKSFFNQLNLSSETELIGKTDFDIYDQMHASDAFNDEQQIIRSGQPIISKVEKEFWFNLDEHWALTTKMPYRDSNGNIIGTFGISRDITEMVKARNLLTESEERYRKLIDSSPFAILVHQSGKVVFANLACAKMVHAENIAEIIGKNIYDFMPAESAKTSRKILKMIAEGSENIPSLEMQYICLDGECIDIDATAIPILYDGKKSALVIANDITERKLAQKKLAETEKRFESMFDNHSASMLLIDPETCKINNANKAAVNFYGYSRKSLLGMNLFDVNMLPESEIRKLIDSATQSENHYLTLRNKLASGEIKTVEIYVCPIKYENKTFLFSIIHDITERKKAEEQLIENDELLKKAQEIANVGHYVLNVNTGKWICSEQLDNIFGIDHTFDRNLELWNDILHPDDRQMMQNYFANHVVANKNIFDKEYRIIRVSDSKVIWVHGLGNLRFDDKGNVSEMLGTIQDITERKRVQRELEESEERYKSILDYSPYSLMVQQNEKLIYVNAATVELFEAHSPDNFLGKNILDFVQEDYKHAMREKINESSLSLKPSSSLEEKLVCVNGKEIEVEMISVPFIFHGIFSTLFITRFIGDLKDKTERLRKLSRAVNQSSAGILIANRHGVIEYVNPKFTEISGYTEEEALGQTTRLLKSGVHTKDFYRDLWETVLKGNEWRGELQNKKKNGELYWEFDSISAIKNETGEITHFLAVKEDITASKKIQEDILLAKDEAEEANKVKSSLLANMSHEFRTPLNGILGFTQLLKDSVMEDDVVMMVEKIEKSGKRLMNTLNAVLSLTELETEDFVVQENEIDLQLFCNGIKNNFERFAIDKGLELILDIQGDQLLTVSDESLLTKIVSSICDNAVKYTNQGKIEIQLDKQISKDNSEFAVIKVTDTGMGIRKENHELIFKEFRQLSEGIRRDFEGLGLGLTLAKRMARLIEAEISVDSEPGKGSTFSVLIPIKTKPSFGYKEIQTTQNQETSNTGHSEEPKALNILLVEDNPLNIEVVQRFLAKTGNVRAVRDGKSALKIAHEENFDLLLIDINLGAGIDGTEVLQTLRLNEWYKTTPAVALTGYASDTNKREFLAKGFTGYLAKPFEKKVLLNLLKELV